MEKLSNSNHVFIPLIDINEGLLSGTITKASIIGTKNILFIIPRSSVKILGETIGDSQFVLDEKKPDEFIENLLSNLEMSVEELEKILTQVLSTDKTRRIFPVNELEKFNVKTGTFTGGLFLKMSGEAKKAANIRGKENKVKLRDFYEEFLK